VNTPHSDGVVGLLKSAEGYAFLCESTTHLPSAFVDDCFTVAPAYGGVFRRCRVERRTCYQVAVSLNFIGMGFLLSGASMEM
jgi:hypothetical protein